MQDAREEKMPAIRRKYTSPAMTERRERIVATAHRILGEGGVAALTIRRLSEDAGVAQRTLYRLFGDKDGVISATVIDRMVEVRENIARRAAKYTLQVVFAELDWMVSELERDSLYAGVVIDFVFSREPRDLEVRELTSVARARFSGWLELEKAQGHVRVDLDLTTITDSHVMHEFLVYRRWSLGRCAGDQCRAELHACFLQTAALVLTGDVREAHVRKLAVIQQALAGLRQDPPTAQPEEGMR
ncbi:TetR family transcriptional regulator [Novosphingobium sp. Leaf2]|nr:TetR family transcriptional regulator [Novosphingobium sp. Leaf2]